MAWDVLENTVISAFIFGLGQAAGLVPCEPIGVELLQQTPMDAFLGDALIAKAKFVRLIEFKRELNKSPKERAKVQRLRTVLGMEPYAHLESLSREVHLVCPDKLQQMAEFCNRAILGYGVRLRVTVDLARFVQETAVALAGPGLSRAGSCTPVSAYMQALAPNFAVLGGSARRPAVCYSL